MSRILIAFAILCFSILSFAEGRAGNGGGGLVVNGNYITIPEAHISIEGHLMMEVPGLSDLDQVLWALQISPDIFRTFMPMINPSSQRSYYSVNHLEPNELLAIKKVYSKILHVPLEKVVIYAVSDAKQKKTFLLPEFFKLESTQEASVLFHEWLWALNPKMTYEDVVYGEQLYYDFAINPWDRWIDLAEYLGQVTGNPQIVISPALARISLTSSIQADVMFGPRFVSCINNALDKGNYQDTKVCLYDWAVGFQLVNPYGEELPLVRAIRRYFGMGGEMSIYQGLPKYTRIPDGWENLKLIGSSANGGGSSLQLLDKNGQLIIEINFLTMKPVDSLNP